MPQFVHGVMCCSCLMFSHWDRDFAFGFKAYQAWNQAWNHISRQGGSLWLHIWIGTSLMPKAVKGHMAFEPSRCISCANWKDLGPVWWLHKPHRQMRESVGCVKGVSGVDVHSGRKCWARASTWGEGPVDIAERDSEVDSDDRDDDSDRLLVILIQNLRHFEAMQ